DPETQAVLSMLESPLAEALNATATGTLAELDELKWKDGYAVTVVLAAEGYPASPRKGDVITGPGLDDPNKVLHAGTSQAEGSPGVEEEVDVISNGGRVLNVLGQGATLAEARAAAYEVLEGLKLEGSFYRRDIGKRA
ncbi:phosphoribosylglycinamide synthetase C domain-containing protein, partial [Corynebacterium striatum]